jgi:hypothetical protein
VLKKANDHECDDRLVFQGEAHVCLVDAAAQCKISVTKLVATLFDKFEPWRVFPHHFQPSFANFRAVCEQIAAWLRN